MSDPSLKSILAATDLSPACEPVLRAAGAIALATGAALHVIHAFDLPPSPYLDTRGGDTTFPGRMEAAKHALRAQVERTVPAGVTVTDPRIEIYAAHRAISEYAAALDVGMVVIGPHTHAGLAAGVLGSTADRLMRTLDAPCLIVRGNFVLPLRRVLVPVDLSEAARPALEIAVSWAGALGQSRHSPPRDTEVVVLHVVPRLEDARELPFDHATIAPGVNTEVEAVFQAAGAPRHVVMREEVVWGEKPANEIVELAEREWMDLVVVATHGHGALARALVGSTASAVARRAPCPVLLVPPRMWLGVRPDGDAASA
jgi:nucleotide-binding universal stress UspA family protein